MKYRYYKPGQIVNNFEFISPGKKKGDWLVKHSCGYAYEVRAYLTKTQPYCINCIPRNRGETHPSWKGYGEIPHDLFTTYKHSAAAKGLEFTVTIQYLWDLFIKQNRKCVFTGEELYFNKTYRTKTDKTASPDRIDSTKGYVPGNIQWIHRDINKLKKNYTDARFIELCKKVAANFSN
jgi:hypothetical protein